MANKRMFAMQIVDSDAFLDMPLSAQCLYFHLNMRADDDGFIGNPKRIQRLIGASTDDLKLLIAKSFVLTFDNGVIVIKHWRMHNTLSSSRYTETVYKDEKNSLLLKDNKSYSLTSGTPLNDAKYIEMSKRQVRRTIDEHQTNTDIDIGLDIDLDKEKEILKEKESETPILSMMLETGDAYEITESMRKDWQQLHPQVDVLKEMQAMKAWLYANPAKRKTRRGMKRFINGWLTRASRENNNHAVEDVPEWYADTKQTEPSPELLERIRKIQKELGEEKNEVQD